ncbi:MAG: 30S ribosomal protein S9 [Myxococcota bacterium]
MATGRRKTAVARVILQPGNGQLLVNQRTMEAYFPSISLQRMVQEPLEVVEGLGKFDLRVRVHGGGIGGQAGAARLGIARALERWNPEFRSLLKRAGYLRRDARIKERKKYGQKGARARFQFSKR